MVVPMLTAWCDMLADVMDFDPRITSDGQGWHCNFHFGYGHDVILEDAINQQSCVQALQYLIPKADAEIHDLEDELAILQCQLKWSVSDKQVDPYEVCCATFKHKMDSLTHSIKSLRDEKICNGDDVDTTKIQQPERIYDVIHTLTEHNFSVPKEQMEILSNELNSLVYSGSVDIGTVLRLTETTSDISAESRELITDFDKPVDTVYEEFFSDIATCARKDLFEGRVLNKTDVEVTVKVEDDVYERTLEERSGFTACLQEYYNMELSKTKAFHHEETEEWMTGYKNSGSDSSPLRHSKSNAWRHEEAGKRMTGSKNSETEMIVKVEVDNIDMNIRDIAAVSPCMMLDQESKDPIDVSQYFSANSVEATYGRNREKLSLSAIIKPQGRKVQRKTLNGAKQANSMMLKPQRKIKKRSFASNDIRQPESLSSEAHVRFHPFHKTVRQRKTANITQSEEVNLLEGSDHQDPASELNTELVICLKAPLSGKQKVSPLRSSPENPLNVASKSTDLDIMSAKEPPAYDLESLRLKLSQQPRFLCTLKLQELKSILKFNKVRKISKLKKEQMIEEVMKLLNAT